MASLAFVTQHDFVQNHKNHLCMITARTYADYDRKELTNETSPGRNVESGAYAKLEWLSPDGSTVRIRLHGQWKPALFLPSSSVRISPALYNNWETEVHLPSLNAITASTSAPSTHPDFAHGIGKRLSHLINSLYENRDRLLPLRTKYSYAFNSAQTLEDLVVSCSNAFVNAAAQQYQARNSGTSWSNARKKASEFWHNIFVDEKFTVQHIIDISPLIGSSIVGVLVDHECVIYMIKYSGFPIGHEFYGEEKVYYGQAQDASARHRTHRLQAGMHPKDKHAINSEHYRCARAASNWVAVKLMTQGTLAPGQSAQARLNSDLFEQIAFLLFNGYAPDILKNGARVKGADGKTPTNFTIKSSDYAMQEQAMTLSAIAEASFEESGFSSAASRSAFDSFGAQGLNISSPIYSYNFGHTSAVWAHQFSPAPDANSSGRHIFHRDSLTATSGYDNEEVDVWRREWSDKDNNRKAFVVSLPVGPDAPEPGDEYWATFEFMVDGVHPAPYFRIPEVGYWSNWAWALKIGLKVIWQSARTKKFYQRYIQGRGREKFFDRSRIASLEDYGFAMILFTFFFRADWPNTQDWIPPLGRAEVVEVKTNFWQQKNVVTPVTGSLGTLPPVVPNSQVVVQRLKDIGLQNVDGRPQDLNREVGVFSNLHPHTKNWLENRTECDRCLLMKNSDTIVSHGLTEGKCRPCAVPGYGHRCETCMIQGLPCTWTPTSVLCGDGFASVQKDNGPFGFDERRGKHFTGEVHKQAEKAFFRPYYNHMACKAQEIPDPNFLQIAGTQLVE